MTETVTFLPLVTEGYIWALAVIAIGLTILSVWRKRGKLLFRVVATVFFILVLLEPSWQQEIRKTISDKVVVIVDQSASQKIDGRAKRTEAAVESVENKIIALGDAEPIVIRTDGQSGGILRKDGTNIFAVLKENLPRLPLSQVAGTVIVTDGQVADVPDDLALFEKLGPINTVLTGRPNEFDRRLSIISAPKYGVINGQAVLRVRADVFGGGTDPLLVNMMQDGQALESFYLQPGEEKELSVTLAHPGQNVISFSTPLAEGELSTVNNQAVSVIEAIRNRMQVLLVSGAPHMGERVWRNLLKSDPSIDLVHFTILRPPMALDPTPPEELALIPFPVDELFQKKIKEFDLIIFDRYRQYDLLQQAYFDNIKQQVKEGGALLLAMGTDEIDDELFQTGLEELLPINQSNISPDIINQPFLPALTEEGKQHPVTAFMSALQEKMPWSSWYNQVPINADPSETMMTGAKGLPLLVLHQAEQGRVAVMSSDNLWQWSKSDQRGHARGPYAPLLRQIIHWLTKEPDLEKGYLKATVKDHEITLSRRSGGADTVETVQMQAPDGKITDVSMPALQEGWQKTSILGENEGLYTFTSGMKTAYAVVGAVSSVEYTELQSTADKMKPVADKTGGTVTWQQDEPGIEFENAGAKDIHLKSKSPYAVTEVKSHRLLPEILSMLGLIGLLFLCWRRESR